MEHRKFSFLVFIIGIIVGFLVAAIIVVGSGMYFYHALQTDTWEDAPRIVRSLGSQIRANMREEASTSVYGTVTKVEGGILEIKANRSLGEETLRFRFDDATVVVYLNNDEESTEVPMPATDLQLGDGVTVQTAESVGSAADQYAVKIIRI